MVTCEKDSIVFDNKNRLVSKSLKHSKIKLIYNFIIMTILLIKKKISKTKCFLP